MKKAHRISLLFLVLFFTTVECFAQLHYRSKQSGLWSAATTWETSPDLITWSAAAAAPNSTQLTVTVRSPHNVRITAAVTFDEVTVDVGGTLRACGNPALTLANGAGIDLTVNGTFIDSLTTGTLTFTGTWLMGANGTLIKMTGSASNNWQNGYNGGIAGIPATSNWILRKVGALNPVISTTAPATGSVYPNLFIENATGAAWTTLLASSFNGAAAFPTIKGNFTIGGGASTNTVDFLNFCTNATPTLVMGNLTVNTGCNIRNNGKGLNVQGNVTVNGTITYGTGFNRVLRFSGGNAQTVSGTGTINVLHLELNKTANDVTLAKPITVDSLATFTSGRLFTTATNLLIIGANATAAGANNLSFCHGPVRKIGYTAFTFPVGKNSDYQPLTLGAGGGSTVFWTEDFGSGCSTGTLGAGYTGPNGTWTNTVMGAEGTEANTWYVSAEENGMPVGTCGAPCGTNRTMHISASPLSLGDLGAAYDAGGLCGLLFCPLTNRRIESPTIDCTGRTNITLTFSYLENGAGTNDDGSVWYFDGVTWALLANTPKTVVCGSGQGLWTAFSIALPASANNNPNVKIGFRWVNNDDGAGTDPSYAIDNVQLVLSPPETFTCEYFYTDPNIAVGTPTVPSLGTISTCEYWVLDRNAGSAARTVTLSFDANSCPITALGTLKIGRWDGVIWQDHGNGGTTGTTAAGTIISSAGIASFSPFTLAQPAVPLPVKWLSFDAVKNGETVDLKWSTASEINNDRFEVQRSTDGIHYQTIAVVKPEQQKSASPKHYASTDAHPQPGRSLYRIAQIDNNGQTDHTENRMILFGQENSGLEVMPSRDDEKLMLDIKGGENSSVTVEIFTVDGRAVSSRTFEDLPAHASVWMDGNSLTPGIYLIKATSGNEISVKKVIW